MAIRAPDGANKTFQDFSCPILVFIIRDEDDALVSLVLSWTSVRLEAIKPLHQSYEIPAKQVSMEDCDFGSETFNLICISILCSVLFLCDPGINRDARKC